MKAELFSYTLEKSDPHQKVALQRILYGYEDISNNGGYHYRRKGLIDKLAGKKLNRGVFIVPLEHSNHIRTILRKNKATFEVLSITV